jgi:hypothetical protein
VVHTRNRRGCRCAHLRDRNSSREQKPLEGSHQGRKLLQCALALKAPKAGLHKKWVQQVMQALQNFHGAVGCFILDGIMLRWLVFAPEVPRNSLTARACASQTCYNDTILCANPLPSHSSHQGTQSASVQLNRGVATATNEAHASEARIDSPVPVALRRFFIYYLNWGLAGAPIATSLAFCSIFALLAVHILTSRAYVRSTPKLNLSRSFRKAPIFLELGFFSASMLW